MRDAWTDEETPLTPYQELIELAENGDFWFDNIILHDDKSVNIVAAILSCAKIVECEPGTEKAVARLRRLAEIKRILDADPFFDEATCRTWRGKFKN